MVDVGIQLACLPQRTPKCLLDVANLALETTHLTISTSSKHKWTFTRHTFRYRLGNAEASLGVSLEKRAKIEVA